jgi:hypothetical protein
LPLSVLLDPRARDPDRLVAAVAGDDVELVALGIGQSGLAVAVFVDVSDVRCAEGQQPLDLSVLLLEIRST